MANEGCGRGGGIAGRFACAGIGLVVGSMLFSGFMVYQWFTAKHVLRGGQWGPVIWGMDGYQVAMHGMLVPLLLGISGLLVPLRLGRRGKSRVIWAVALVAAGVISFAVCWAWTVFVMYCWLMAHPG
jgi:hypothetical protein